MNYQIKVNTLIRASDFDSFSLRTYYIRSGVKKQLKRTQRPKGNF